MKVLRVLTGIHAGAQIRMTSGTVRIGADDEADICINDWQGGDLTLELGGDGVVRARHTDNVAVLVPDFVAMPYGDIVLCVGPDDALWPRDLDLLEGLWRTAEPQVAVAQADLQAPRYDAAASSQVAAPRGTGTVRAAGVALACTTLIGAVLAADMMFAGTQSSHAANVEASTDAMAQQVGDALRHAGFKDLQAGVKGRNVVVRGIVNSLDDHQRARRICDQLAKGRVVREYDIAQNDVETIRQLLGATGARVAYAGEGVFTISGTVQSRENFADLLESVKADLGANVKRIDVDVKEARAPAAGIEYSEMVDTGGVRYIETPDGTKHLYFAAASERKTDRLPN
jgi:type III secretion protein D